MHWDTRSGVEIEALYPEDMEEPNQMSLLQIYGQHEYSQEKGTITLNVGDLNIISYYSGPEKRYYMVLFLDPSEEANDLDPEYTQPYIILSWCYIIDAVRGKSKSPRESLEKAFELAQKVLALDESDAVSHQILANVYIYKGGYEKAIAESERAVALDPNSAKGNMNLAESLMRGGRPQEAVPLLKKSMAASR